MKTWTFLLLASVVSAASPCDSLAVRFGAGVSRPMAHEEYSSSLPGVDFERRLATLPTAVADVEALRRMNGWEAGMACGFEGEVLSTARLDMTDFSLFSLELRGTRRLLAVRSSSLWFGAGAGWAFPVLCHAPLDGQESWGGPRLSLGLRFRRSNLELETGAAFSRVTFTDADAQASYRTTWTIGHWSLRARWDWLAP